VSAATTPRRGPRPHREPRELSAALGGEERPGTGLAKDPPFRWPSARPVVVGIVLLTLVSGVAYPYVFSLVAETLTPSTADGGNITLGQNITNPKLFWLRPSIIDYQPYSGAGLEIPYGPVDPLLYNQTLLYIQEYGLQNVSVPLNLVSPSASGLDPAVTPEAALVQIPRVAHFSNLTQSALLRLVDAAIISPEAGFIGPAYVDIVSLDLTLLALENSTVITAGATTSTLGS
jgi:potassium-transporting ATPase KdpC subunit